MSGKARNSCCCIKVTMAREKGKRRSEAEREGQSNQPHYNHHRNNYHDSRVTLSTLERRNWNPLHNVIKHQDCYWSYRRK